MADRLIRKFEVVGDLCNLRWSPDGRRIAVATNDGSVRVVTADGREVWRAPRQGSSFLYLSWSSTGLIGTGSYPGRVTVLDAATGALRHEYHQLSQIEGVSWASDGVRLAASARVGETGGVWVYDTAHPDRVRHYESGSTSTCSGVCWSPDDRHVAARVDSDIAIWDAATGARTRTLSGHTSGAFDVRWAPDGRRLVSGGWDNTARVWDADTGACLVTFSAHGGSVHSVAWAPDGRVLASSGDKVVRVWDPDTGAERAVLTGHTDTVWAVAIAPDGRVLASGASDGTVRLWDVSDLCGAPARVTVPGAGPEGAYLTRQLATIGLRPADTGAAGNLDLWVPTGLPGADPATGCLGLIANAHHRALDLFPDGRHLFAGIRGANRWAKWDLGTGRPVWEVEGPFVSDGRDAAVSPDGSRVAVASFDLGACASVAPGGPLVRLPQSNLSRVGASAVAWAPDGKRLVWGTYLGGAVPVLDADTGENKGELSFHGPGGPGQSVSWAPDDRSIAGGRNEPSRDGLCVWGANGFALRWHAELPEPVTAVRFSADGRRLASGEKDGRVVIWDADTGRPRTEFRTGARPVYRFAWSTDGRLVALTTADGNWEQDLGDGVLRVWDVERSVEVWWCEGLSKERPGLAWAAGGGFLAAGCPDGIRLFDVRHLMTPAAPAAPPAPAAVPHLRALPAALAAVHRAGRHPPLALLADLLALVAGRPPSNPALLPLGADPGVARLAGLRWPAAARPALAALLLAELSAEPGWAPPPELPPSGLRRALGAVLGECEPAPVDAPPIANRALAAGAARVTAGVAAALVAVGPAACALDPSVPLRLAARPGPAARRPPPRPGGLAASSGGSAGAGPVAPGGGRAGSARSGPPQAVAPWQWALPSAVLGARARRGELVYRAAPADPPVPARPAVVVLDTSAGAPGAAGGVLRAAAAAVLRAALAAGGAALVTAGGGWSGPVRSEADLAGVWSAPARPGRAGAADALAAAGRWRAGLGSGAVLVVLAAPWFGWSEPGAARALTGASGPSGGRGAFAGPPGWSGRPTLAPDLFRWCAAPADRLPPPHDLLALVLA